MKRKSGPDGPVFVREIRTKPSSVPKVGLWNIVLSGVFYYYFVLDGAYEMLFDVAHCQLIAVSL